MTLLLWEEEVKATNAEETLLLPPLLAMLRKRRWISPKSIIRTEFAWHGRRVDLAIKGSRNRTAAFELKLGSFGRVLEQAMYNRLSFDRSWIVIDGVPRPANLEHALSNGIGVVVVDDFPRVLLAAELQTINPVVRERLNVNLGSGLK